MKIYIVRIDTAVGENFLHAFTSMDKAFRFYEERNAELSRDCAGGRSTSEAWCYFPEECVLDESIPAGGAK